MVPVIENFTTLATVDGRAVSVKVVVAEVAVPTCSDRAEVWRLADTPDASDTDSAMVPLNELKEPTVIVEV